jgi:hypothetical protein
MVAAAPLTQRRTRASARAFPTKASGRSPAASAKGSPRCTRVEPTSKNHGAPLPVRGTHRGQTRLRPRPSSSGDTSGTDPPPSPSCWPSSLHTTHGPTRPKGRGGSFHSNRTRASAREFPTKAAAARRPHPKPVVQDAPGSSPRVRNAARSCPSRNQSPPSARRPPRHRASRPRAAFLWRTAQGRTEDLPPPSSASWPTTAGGGGHRPGRAPTKRADCASRGPPRGPSPVPSADPRSPAVPRRGGPGGRRPAAPWCRPHRPLIEPPASPHCCSRTRPRPPRRTRTPAS